MKVKHKQSIEPQVGQINNFQYRNVELFTYAIL